jgi:hypothetical protein
MSRIAETTLPLNQRREGRGEGDVDTQSHHSASSSTRWWRRNLAHQATVAALFSRGDAAAAVVVVANEKRELCDLRWAEKRIGVVRPPLLPCSLKFILSSPRHVCGLSAGEEGRRYIHSVRFMGARRGDAARTRQRGGGGWAAERRSQMGRVTS